MLSFLYVYSDHSILECYNLFSGVELSLRSFFCYFYYGDDFRKVPNIRAYGGMRVVKGKFGNYFELDLKDDDTEKFFKILGEQLQSLGGAYLDEKPWNLKSPVVEYEVLYSVHCKIPQNFNELKVGEYF